MWLGGLLAVAYTINSPRRPRSGLSTLEWFEYSYNLYASAPCKSLSQLIKNAILTSRFFLRRVFHPYVPFIPQFHYLGEGLNSAVYQALCGLRDGDLSNKRLLLCTFHCPHGNQHQRQAADMHP